MSWNDVKQMIGCKHLMATPSDRYNWQEILNDATTKILLYTSSLSTSNLIFVRTKGGETSVVVISPYFGYYLNRELQLPVQLDKNIKSINAAFIMYSIDRNPEYLNDVQDDIVRAKKSCLMCTTPGARESSQRTIEIKKGKDKAVQLVRNAIEAQKYKEHHHTICVFLDCEENENMIDELVNLLNLTKLSTNNKNYTYTYLKDFIVIFKVLSSVEELENPGDNCKTLFLYTQSDIKVVETKMLNYFQAFSVILCVRRVTAKSQVLSNLILQDSLPTIQIFCYFITQIKEQLLHPALPRSEVKVDEAIKELLIVKLINCNRATQHGTQFSKLQNEIQKLQNSQ